MSKLDTALAALSTGFSGTLIRPADAAYDATRQVMYGGFDRRPGAIARAKSAADVQAVVNAARQSGVELAVRSGGHSNAGHSTLEGGLVLDLREMKAIAVDAAAETAWAETGATAIEVTKAALEHGLVVGFGDAGSVGIAGITLGGGVGYLARQWGLTIDSLLAVELVTAGGRVRIVDAAHEPELFWALRGGGGNFGVATRLKFKLRPLPEFTGGMLALPATPETIAGFVAAASAAPEALSTIANVMPAPPMPFLPKEAHGKLIILGMLAFAGPAAEAEKAIAPFRALAKPYADFVKPGPYTQMYPPEDPNYHPTAAGRNMFVNRLGVGQARTILDTLEASDASFRVTQIRVLGGAVARVPVEATAYAHRKAPIMLNLAAFWTTPEDRVKQEAWVERFMASLKQEVTGAYVNFLADEGPERVAVAYPGATGERLAKIKAQVDPDNLFRHNQNIVPTK